MSEAQPDLFDWRHALPVFLSGVVCLSTSHVDGVAVYWASRCDWLRDGSGLRFGPGDRAGPFADLSAAERAFGRETSRQKIKKAIKEARLSVETGD